MLAEKEFDINVQEQTIKKGQRTFQNARKGFNFQTLSGKKKRKTIFQFMIVGVLLVMFVAGAAFASSLAYNNNLMADKNKAIDANIQELKVKIQSTMNVAMVEKKALKDLGMIYPTESQIVQLGEENNINNFAEVLRNEAFK